MYAGNQIGLIKKVVHALSFTRLVPERSETEPERFISSLLWNSISKLLRNFWSSYNLFWSCYALSLENPGKLIQKIGHKKGCRFLITKFHLCMDEFSRNWSGWYPRTMMILTEDCRCSWNEHPPTVGGLIQNSQRYSQFCVEFIDWKFTKVRTS